MELAGGMVLALCALACAVLTIIAAAARGTGFIPHASRLRGSLQSRWSAVSRRSWTRLFDAEDNLLAKAVPCLLLSVGLCHIIWAVHKGEYSSQLLFSLIEVSAVSSLIYYLAHKQTARSVRAIANEAATHLVRLHCQAEDLADEKDELEAELNAVVQQSHPALRAGSPADLFLEVIDSMLEGGMPRSGDLLLLRDIILNGQHQDSLYQPLDLWQHLHTLTMEPDVEAALFHQLFGTCLPPSAMSPVAYPPRDAQGGLDMQEGVGTLDSDHEPRPGRAQLLTGAPSAREAQHSTAQAVGPEDGSAQPRHKHCRPTPQSGQEGSRSSEEDRLMGMLAALASESAPFDQPDSRLHSRPLRLSQLMRLQQQTHHRRSFLEEQQGVASPATSESLACFPPHGSGNSTHGGSAPVNSNLGTRGAPQEQVYARWQSCSSSGHAMHDVLRVGSEGQHAGAFRKAGSLGTQVHVSQRGQSAPSFTDTQADAAGKDSSASPIDPYAPLLQQRRRVSKLRLLSEILVSPGASRHASGALGSPAVSRHASGAVGTPAAQRMRGVPTRSTTYHNFSERGPPVGHTDSTDSTPQTPRAHVPHPSLRRRASLPATNFQAIVQQARQQASSRLAHSSSHPTPTPTSPPPANRFLAHFDSAPAAFAQPASLRAQQAQHAQHVQQAQQAQHAQVQQVQQERERDPNSPRAVLEAALSGCAAVNLLSSGARPKALRTSSSYPELAARAREATQQAPQDTEPQATSPFVGPSSKPLVLPMSVGDRARLLAPASGSIGPKSPEPSVPGRVQLDFQSSSNGRASGSSTFQSAAAQRGLENLQGSMSIGVHTGETGAPAAHHRACSSSETAQQLRLSPTSLHNELQAAQPSPSGPSTSSSSRGRGGRGNLVHLQSPLVLRPPGAQMTPLRRSTTNLEGLEHYSREGQSSAQWSAQQQAAAAGSLFMSEHGLARKAGTGVHVRWFPGSPAHVPEACENDENEVSDLVRSGEMVVGDAGAQQAQQQQQGQQQHHQQQQQQHKHNLQREFWGLHHQPLHPQQQQQEQPQQQHEQQQQQQQQQQQPQEKASQGVAVHVAQEGAFALEGESALPSQSPQASPEKHAHQPKAQPGMLISKDSAAEAHSPSACAGDEHASPVLGPQESQPAAPSAQGGTSPSVPTHPSESRSPSTDTCSHSTPARATSQPGSQTTSKQLPLLHKRTTTDGDSVSTASTRHSVASSARQWVKGLFEAGSSSRKKHSRKERKESSSSGASKSTLRTLFGKATSSSKRRQTTGTSHQRPSADTSSEQEAGLGASSFQEHTAGAPRARSRSVPGSQQQESVKAQAQSPKSRKVSFLADWPEAESKGPGSRREACSTELSAQMSGGREGSQSSILGYEHRAPGVEVALLEDSEPDPEMLMKSNRVQAYKERRRVSSAINYPRSSTSDQRSSMASSRRSPGGPNSSTSNIRWSSDQSAYTTGFATTSRQASLVGVLHGPSMELPQVPEGHDAHSSSGTTQSSSSKRGGSPGTSYAAHDPYHRASISSGGSATMTAGTNTATATLATRSSLDTQAMMLHASHVSELLPVSPRQVPHRERAASCEVPLRAHSAARVHSLESSPSPLQPTPAPRHSTHSAHSTQQHDHEQEAQALAHEGQHTAPAAKLMDDAGAPAHMATRSGTTASVPASPQDQQQQQQQHTHTVTPAAGAAAGAATDAAHPSGARVVAAASGEGVGGDASRAPQVPKVVQEEGADGSGAAQVQDASVRVLPEQAGMRRGGSSEMPLLTPRPLPLLEMEAVLAHAFTSFSFDTFHLNNVTQGHPLSTLGYYLFHKTGLITAFDMQPVKLARFLRKMEAGYPPQNPYHNAIHAADVLQTLHVIIQRGSIMPHYADRLSVLAALLAAIMHDYEHMGLTNDFLINSSSTLAIRYNDRAPLENHHLAASFTVLCSPDQNFLTTMPRVDYARMRKIIIDLVLATDMKQHFALVGQLNAVLRRVKPRYKPAGECSSPYSPAGHSAGKSPASRGRPTRSITVASNGGSTTGFQRASLDSTKSAAAFHSAWGTSPSTHASSGGSRRLLSERPSRETADSGVTQQSSCRPSRARISLPQCASLDTRSSSAAAQLQAALQEAASFTACSLPALYSQEQPEPGSAHSLALRQSASVSHGISTHGASAAAIADAWRAGQGGASGVSSHHSHTSSLGSDRTNALARTSDKASHSSHSRPTDSSGSKHTSNSRGSSDRSYSNISRSKPSKHSSFNSRSSNMQQSNGQEEPLGLDDAQRLLLLQIALKCADLGHVAEDHDVHVKWVHCLEEEFYRQGDREKAAGLPVSPLFDRTKPGVTKSQVGFFDVVILPLFQAFAKAVPGTHPLVEGIEQNYRHWKQEQRT